MDLSTYEVVELTSSLPYNPQDHYSRQMKTSQRISVEDWRAQLGFPTLAVTKATLYNTTQMVQTLQAEMREYMSNHFKMRIWVLMPRRINNVCYSDTLFSSICSV